MQSDSRQEAVYHEQHSRLAMENLTKHNRGGSMDLSRHISKAGQGIWVMSRDKAWTYRDRPSPKGKKNNVPRRMWGMIE
jgi:hypothetical protein